jgi:hypothetical protein
MNNGLANLTEEQHKAINNLEKELRVVLIAFDGYRPEDENGAPEETQ